MSEGLYAPQLVTATVGLPAAAIPFVIPGLPQGFKFPYTVVGKVADSFFSTTNNTPFATVSVGAGGLGTFVINADRSGVMNVNVTAGSAANRILGILLNAQLLIGSGQIPPFSFPVGFRDNNKTPPETHEGVQCLIGQVPDVDYGASDGTLPWSFVTLQLISNFSSRLSV